MPTENKIEETGPANPVKKKRGRPKKEKPIEYSSDVVSAEIPPEKKPERGGVGGNGNLIPLNQRTKEEQREIQVLGGKASVESRRKKKELREFMKDFLMSDANPALIKNLKALGVDPDQYTNLAALCTRVFTAGVSKGDLNAARTCIEWAGMAPLQQERENEAIARMSQVINMANGGNEEEEEEDTVVFYIPENGRAVVNGKDLVTITDA